MGPVPGRTAEADVRTTRTSVTAHVCTFRRFLGVGGLVLVGLFLVSIPAVTPYLRGDGVGYYAWLRSPAIDGDLNFENEFARGDPAFRAATYTEVGELKPGMRTSTGRVRNQWSVGPALLWSPFFAVGHAVTLTGEATGIGWHPDGYALPYRWFAAFGTALYGFLSLLVAYLLVRRLVGDGPALLGSLAVWGASSLLVYQYFLPFWPFGVGAFAGAVVLAAWWTPSWRPGRWVLLGLSAGAAAIAHPVGIAWSALPLLSLVGLETGGGRKRLRAVGVFAVAGAVAVTPQLVAKTIVHGSPLETGYQDQMNWLAPDLSRVLFSADHGLLSWTPVAVLALAGLMLLIRRDRRLGVGLGAVFLVLLYVVSSHVTYEQSSFGNRFFVVFTPGFVVGTAVLAQVSWRRWRAGLIAVSALLIAWNLLFAFQWAWGLVPKRGPVDWGEVARNQVTAAPRELVRAISLFINDRGELIQRVQRADLQQLDVRGSE